MSDSTKESQSTMESWESSFSQVVFMDVPHSYPPNTPVICTFTVTAGLEPTSADWIGIFKVGWNSTKKYHNYVWVEPPSENDGTEPLKLQVLFTEYYLPKDDGEFYQFCYVDSSGQVRGASTPFCIQNPAESSQDCSLEKDLLVITTQEQAEQMEKEKKGLMTEKEHLKEENMILRNELEERLHEIHRLRTQVDKLKSERTTETLAPKELKLESTEQITEEQQILSYTSAENETKLEQESLTHLHEKYEKAVQKIIALKQEKTLLEQQIECQQSEISQLSPKVKEAEQDFNRLQDHVQLLQVDVQSSRKENERLHAEIQELMGMKRQWEELQEENRALRTTLSEQGPSDGDKSSTKVQIQTLLKQLTEARGTLRKEIANSNETNRRAEKAEQDLEKLKKQLEEMTLTEDKQPKNSERELEEAHRKIKEQVNMSELVRLEKEELSKQNEQLKDKVATLEKQVYDLQVASVAAFSQPQPQPSPHSPSFTDPLNTQSASHYYESITELSGPPTGKENKKVCRHCQESFPDISEDELAMHEQSHKVCPFCTLICDDLAQQEFEDHVYGHE